VTAAPVHPGDLLTERELQFLRLTANGHSGESAARALHVSHHTVKTHHARIYTKLGARSRAHAVALAIATRQLHPRDIHPTDAARSEP